MNLTISKEKVLQAAAECPAAKQTLEILFPEIFKVEDKYEDKYFDLSKLVINQHDFNTGLNIFTMNSCLDAGMNVDGCIQLRTAGPHRHKGFLLNGRYNWELIEEGAHFVLVPTKKTNPPPWHIKKRDGM